MVWRIEDETLRFRGKREFIELLKSGNVDTILHGHLHYTSEGDVKGIRCVNGGGAVYPMNPEAGLRYNLLQIDDQNISAEIISVAAGTRRAPKYGRRLRTVKTFRRQRQSAAIVEKA